MNISNLSQIANIEIIKDSPVLTSLLSVATGLFIIWSIWAISLRLMNSFKTWRLSRLRRELTSMSPTDDGYELFKNLIAIERCRIYFGVTCSLHQIPVVQSAIEDGRLLYRDLRAGGSFIRFQGNSPYIELSIFYQIFHYGSWIMSGANFILFWAVLGYAQFVEKDYKFLPEYLICLIYGFMFLFYMIPTSAALRMKKTLNPKDTAAKSR